MGKGKYEGGSVPHTFRLPKVGFKEAKETIETFLGSLEKKKLSYEELYYDKLRVEAEREFTPASMSPEYKAFMQSSGTTAGIGHSFPTVAALTFFVEGEDPVKISGNEYFQKAMSMISFGEFENENENYGGILPLHSLEKIAEQKKIEPSGVVRYACGCFFDSEAFRKAKDCNLKKEDHKIRK